MMDLESCDPEQTARCKKLAVHVLQELILDFAGHGHTDRRGERAEQEVEKSRREAKRYLLADGSEPMGFAWICEVLEIDEAALRNHLILKGADKWVAQWRRSGMTPDGTWVTDLPKG